MATAFAASCAGHSTVALSASSASTQQRDVRIPAVGGLRVAAAGGAAGLKNGFIGSVKFAAMPSLSRQRKQREQVQSRPSAAVKEVEAEVDKPLGIEMGQKEGGPILITNVAPGGNGASAGLKVGDQVVYTSSFFGDELWPADKLSFVRTVIRAKPDSIYFVVARGGEVETKRLPKRPAPSRFGDKKLTEAQKARATHICLDCGYIYTLAKPFDEQPDTFGCPQCSAPKKRFAGYDAETGSVIGGSSLPIVVILTLILGVVGLGAGVYFGLQ